MNETWLTTTNMSFVEEYYTMIYIFDRSFSWIDFLDMQNHRFCNKLIIPQLQVLASFGDCQFPELYIKKGNVLAYRIADCFQENGFEIKCCCLKL